MKRKWTLLILVIGLIATVRSAPSSVSSLKDASNAETSALPRLSNESASKTINTSNDTLLPSPTSSQITAVESGLNGSGNATLLKDTVNLTSSNVENFQVNSTSESRGSGISVQEPLNSESGVKSPATQEEGPVGDPAPEGGSSVDDSVTQERGPLVYSAPQGWGPVGDPAPQGGSPAGDPALQGGSPFGDPATQGGSPAGDPATQGGSPAGDPATQGGSPAGDSATQGGSPAGDPATQGGSPASNPATQGGSPGVNPVTQGGSPVVDPATQGGSPGIDPATQGGSPGVDPATQGGSLGVDAATQGGSPVDDSIAVDANQEGGSDEGNTDNDSDYFPSPVQETKGSPIPALPDDSKDETVLDKNNYSDGTIPIAKEATIPVDDSLPYGFEGNEFGSQSSMSNSGSAYGESYATDLEEESDGSLKREDEGNSFAAHNQEGQLTDDKDSHFFAYFLTIMVTAIIFYLVFHNKQRIIALIIEGRAPRNGRGRRSSTKAKYHKLDNNLEEAITATKGTNGC